MAGVSLGQCTAPQDLLVSEGVKRESFPLELGSWLLSKRDMSFVTCLVHLRGADPTVPTPLRAQRSTGQARRRANGTRSPHCPDSLRAPVLCGP